MNNFSRTIEKILAWIANVILIFVTIVLSILSFSGMIESAIKSEEFKTGLKTALLDQGQANILTASDIENITNMISPVFSVVSVLLIIITVIALVATFTMGKRILSGGLFLILSIVTLVLSFGTGFVVYGPYFVVAILLFVRKPPVNYDNFYNQNTKEEVEKIEYI